MLTTLKYSARICWLGWQLARHDALFVFSVTPIPTLALLPLYLFRKRSDASKGTRLANALQAMGPSFIKFGQALSTRPDLLGEDLASGLTILQDKLPPFAYKAALATVEQQLRAPLDTLYSSFAEVPVAAASIAQVHFAVTRDGRDVAVKILRPGIEARFARDIALFRWLAASVETCQPELGRLRLREMVETFATAIRMELDLRMEAAAAEELRENSKDDADFYVPTIDWQRTAQRVMTLERIEGISIGDLAALDAAGIDRNATMEKAARAFFNQVFRDGYFHADMHPGNLFVLRDGRLAPVDFGIMGRIDYHNQLILARILWGFFNGDYAEVARLHHQAGWIPPHVSVESFAQAVRAVGTPIMGKALHEISVGNLLGQLITIAQDFEMIAQPQLLLLQKTIVTAEGVGRMLNPAINMWKISEPLISRWAEDNLSARARIKTALGDLSDTLREAPRLIRELRDYIEESKIKNFSAEQKDSTSVDRILHPHPAWILVSILATILIMEVLL